MDPTADCLYRYACIIYTVYVFYGLLSDTPLSINQCLKLPHYIFLYAALTTDRYTYNAQKLLIDVKSYF